MERSTESNDRRDQSSDARVSSLTLESSIGQGQETTFLFARNNNEAIVPQNASSQFSPLSYDERPTASFGERSKPRSDFDQHDSRPVPSTPQGKYQALNPQTRKKSRAHLALLWPWRFQILAAVTSIASFGALVAVAAVYSGRPLSDWNSDWLSINAVVAALTTLLRLTLLVLVANFMIQQKWVWFSEMHVPGRPLRDLEDIDDASRGPMGSLLWLFKHPSAMTLVNLGAIWTVLSVAFDVFSQQAIQLNNRLVINNTAGAHLPWAQNVTVLGQAWYAAMYDGFLNSVADDLPATCPTGNCTWGTVPSLGVCGKCFDDTERSENDPGWRICSNGSVPLCNYTGLFTRLLDVPPPDSTIDLEDLNYTYGIPATSIGVGFHLAYDRFPWVPLLYEVIQLNYTHKNRTSRRINIGTANITQCAFWFCMQAYSTKVTLGIQEQTFRANSSPSTIGQIPNEDDGTNFFFQGIPGFNMEDRNFTVSLPYSSWDAFTFTAGQSHLGTDGLSTDQVLMSEPLAKCWQDTNDNRSAWVANVAKSLSNALRQENSAPLSEKTYSGTAYSTVTYIEIVWPWIAYPGCMLFAGLLLFAMTVASAARVRRGELWGNGSLELLLAGLDQHVKSAAEDENSTSHEALLRTVGQRKVRLEQGSGTWHFKSADSPHN